MATYTIDITGVDKNKKLIAVELNGTRHTIALGVGWTTANMIAAVNAVAPGALNIDSNTADVLTVTDITQLDFIEAVDAIIDDFSGAAEDSAHPDVVDDNDVSAGSPGSDTLTFVDFNGPTTFGSSDGALHTGNYRIGSALTLSGTNFPYQDGSGTPGATTGTRVGSQGRFWTVSKGWTDDNGVVHDNYLSPGLDGHTDASGNPAGKYWAVDAGSTPAEYFRKTYAGAGSGENIFSMYICPSCIGPAYDDRTVPCVATPKFEVRIYEADGTTLLTTLNTGSLANDGIWKPVNLSFNLAVAQDIVIVLWNDQIQVDPDPAGNDFLIDRIGLRTVNIQDYAAVTADAVNDAMGSITVGVSTDIDVALNDVTCSSGAVTYALNGGATNGSVTLVAGIASVTAAAAGAGSQDYNILCDGNIIDSATISWVGAAVTANAVDDDIGTVAMSSSTNVNMSLNDTACSSGVTTYQLTGPAVNAFVTSSGTSMVVTVLGAGPGSQSYNILCDGNVVDTATVTWVGAAVTATAVNDSFGVLADGVAVSINLALNDTACSSGVTAYVLVGAPTNGTATLAGSTVTITPSGPGADSVDYNILCDGNVVDTATVDWSVAAVTATAVNDDMGSLIAGDPATFNVATNDTPCSAGATTYALTGVATNGTVTLTGSTVTVTPIAQGAGSQDYNILCDGNVTGTATVSWTGAAVTANAVNDTLGIIAIATPTPIDLSANDTACSSGATTYQLAGTPVNGTVTLAGFTATVSVASTGAGSVDYNILCDGNVVDTATLSWAGPAPTATAVNDPLGNLLIGSSTDIDLATNDTACSAGATSYQLQGAALNGNVTLVGSIATVVPTSGGAGTQSYNILCDGTVISSAVISWTGLSINAVAVSNNLGALPAGSPRTVNVAANDTACSGGATTTYAMVTGSLTGGSAAQSGTTGQFTVNPTADGGFDYNILCDGNVTGTATVSWTLVRTAVATDDYLGSLPIGVATSVDVSINDTACSAGVTKYSLVAGSEINTAVVQVSSGGSVFNFTPQATGQFKYNILCDGNVVDIATVSWGSGPNKGRILVELTNSSGNVLQSRYLEAEGEKTNASFSMTHKGLQAGIEYKLRTTMITESGTVTEVSAKNVSIQTIQKPC